MTAKLHQPTGDFKLATFGLGCFWGSESAFGVIPGVVATRVGYCGGQKQGPTYRAIGDHTEAVQVKYDPSQLSYETLLGVFWANHDPTYRYKPQYKSAIFYHDDTQKKAAEASLEAERSKHQRKIETDIQPVGVYTDAEDYHQKYNLKLRDAIFSSLGLKSNKTVIDSFVAAKLNGFVAGYGKMSDIKGQEWGLPDEMTRAVKSEHARGDRGAC